MRARRMRLRWFLASSADLWGAECAGQPAGASPDRAGGGSGSAGGDRASSARSSWWWRLIATLKAGAAYLPLDPEYPAARLEYMLSDAAPVVVLTSETDGLACRIDGTGVGFGRWSCGVCRKPAENPVGAVWPEHPAYVIYTSGSTGTPKGVVVTYAGVSEPGGRSDRAARGEA